MAAKNDIHNQGKLPRQEELKNPYQVPDTFFSDLPEQMLEVCKSDDHKKRFLQGIPMMIRYAAAAAILIMIIWGANIIFSENGSGYQDDLTEFSVKDVYQYNLTHLVQLEEEYLLSMLDEEEINDLIISDIDQTEISDEEIIEYLLSENHIEYHIVNDY